MRIGMMIAAMGVRIGMMIAAMGVLGFAQASTAADGDPQAAVMFTPKDLTFAPGPPTLPPGAQVAVLHGDPSKPAPFALRLKFPDGYRVPPHWHSRDEELTIVSGTFMLAMGDKAGEQVHSLPPGSYHFLPAKVHHSASVKGETVVQLNGTGPFDIHYLDPADDPTKHAVRK